MKHSQRCASLAALCLAAALAVSSCRFLQRTPPRALELGPETTGAALAVAARFAAPDDDAPDFFERALADSGILALQVVLRNGGPGALAVHSANGMRIGAGFEGLRLVCGEDTLHPLHPGAAAAALVGARRAKGYRRPGAFEITLGPVIAPFGLYTIYKEVSVGRFYRPLFSHSLYPPLESGLLEPIRLEPGEERRGWLYFDAPPGGVEGDCELLVIACTPREFPGRLPGYDFEFSRDEGAFGAGRLPPPDAPRTGADGYLFSLLQEEKRSALYCRAVRALVDDPAAQGRRVTAIAAKAAVLADASHRGDRAAVGVDFTSKSKAISVRFANGPAVVAERVLSRGIRRVHPVGEGVCAVTENGYGHYFDERSRPGSSGRKLARGFDDASMIDGTLFVFSRDKGLEVFDAAGESRFALLEKKQLGRGRRSAIGTLGGSLVLINRGVSLRGDTIAIFDPAGKAEMRRGALAGRVHRASCGGRTIVLQLEDGTVLRVAPGPLGTFRIEEAGFLPFRARTIEVLADSFVAVGEDGRIVVDAIGSLGPGKRGALEISTPVR